MTAEHDRLADSTDWQLWGSYLSERAWGTVREDYSADGDAWSYFPHDHARCRAYRWNEDGLAGISDHKGRLCFALALWNEQDPILKERLFGLGNPEGNHGEDVKESYFYLDCTPTHSWMTTLYKYPQAAFPYADLVATNRARGRHEPEYELADTGVFSDDRYFDVFVSYAKASPTDICIGIRAVNRGPAPAPLHVLPTLWLRNTWSWHDLPPTALPALHARDATTVAASHPQLGSYRLACASGAAGPALLFTENETNPALFGAPTVGYTKDAFHRCIIGGEAAAINPEQRGTKAAAHYHAIVAPGGELVIQLRLTAETAPAAPPHTDEPPVASAEPVPAPTPEPGAFADFAAVMALRQREADDFYATLLPAAHDRRAAARLSAGAGRDAMVQAVLSLPRPRLAAGRSALSRTARRAPGRPQPRLDAISTTSA